LHLKFEHVSILRAISADRLVVFFQSVLRLFIILDAIPPRGHFRSSVLALPVSSLPVTVTTTTTTTMIYSDLMRVIKLTEAS